MPPLSGPIFGRGSACVLGLLARWVQWPILQSSFLALHPSGLGFGLESTLGMFRHGSCGWVRTWASVDYGSQARDSDDQADEIHVEGEEGRRSFVVEAGELERAGELGLLERAETLEY